MKEYKFRVWNGEQMISPDYIDRKGYAHWKENSIPEISNKIMQFTGMVDKNEKEIFEGDFVVIPEGYGGDHRYYQTVGIITYENAEFYPKNINERDGIVMQDWHWHNMEVIGNIHKNIPVEMSQRAKLNERFKDRKPLENNKDDVLMPSMREEE